MLRPSTATLNEQVDVTPSPSLKPAGTPVDDPLNPALQSLLQIVEELQKTESKAPVRPPVRPDELRGALSLDPPSSPRPWADVAEDLRELALYGPRTSTRAFFNQLFGGRLGSATAADMLVSVLNQSMYTYKVAGPQVLVERSLIRHMGKLVGYDEPDGTFAPGGSLSNLVGMVLARNVAFPEVREDGLGNRRPVLYVSAEAHYSIRKNAGLLGLGRQSVRSVPVDERGRMDADALSEAIHADRAAGRDPFLVVATAGTTVRGAYDPLVALGDICQAHGLWLHVDGAFGGSLLLSERTKVLLEGSELSDSFTWDAHKLMGVPLTSSVLLVRSQGLLDSSLSEQADYLFQGDREDAPDPGHRSLQCGRRNDALKLWAAWQRHGDEGFAARIDRCIHLAQLFAKKLASRPNLSMVEPPISTNVCFVVPGVDATELVEHLNRTGRAMVGTAWVPDPRSPHEKNKVIRWVAVNPDISSNDVDRFLDGIEAAATEVKSRC